MIRLDTAARDAFARAHPGWDLEDETIRKTFVLADFSESMGFVTRVALLAEVADHHPDIDIRWNRVTIALSTHSEGVLTSKDTDLAEAIERL